MLTQPAPCICSVFAVVLFCFYLLIWRQDLTMQPVCLLVTPLPCPPTWWDYRYTTIPSWTFLLLDLCGGRAHHCRSLCQKKDSISTMQKRSKVRSASICLVNTSQCLRFLSLAPPLEVSTTYHRCQARDQNPPCGLRVVLQIQTVA